MRLGLLDTDTLSLVQRADPIAVGHFEKLSPSQRGITIVSLQEQMRGRLAQISKAQSLEKLRRAYQLFYKTHHSLRQIQILHFDDSAVERFQELSQKKIRIGVLDLRIASIALANHSIFVTSNRRDFSKIPNLDIEDWRNKV